MADILIVDDVKGIADILNNILTKEGFSTNVVYDGAQAIEKIKSNNYRLVITDVIMPHNDGFDVINFIQGHAPDTKIIVMTGGGVRVSALETIKAIGNKANVALQKPVTKDKLIESVTSLLN